MQQFRNSRRSGAAQFLELLFVVLTDTSLNTYDNDEQKQLDLSYESAPNVTFIRSALLYAHSLACTNLAKYTH